MECSPRGALGRVCLPSEVPPPGPSQPRGLCPVMGRGSPALPSFSLPNPPLRRSVLPRPFRAGPCSLAGTGPRGQAREAPPSIGWTGGRPRLGAGGVCRRRLCCPTPARPDRVSLCRAVLAKAGAGLPQPVLRFGGVPSWRPGHRVQPQRGRGRPARARLHPLWVVICFSSKDTAFTPPRPSP